MAENKVWIKKSTSTWWKRRGFGQIDPITLSQIRSKKVKLCCGHYLCKSSYDKLIKEFLYSPEGVKCPFCRANIY